MGIIVLSVAFTKEESANTAAEIALPDRPISQHPNFVTGDGLRALKQHLEDACAAYEAAQAVEDINERRRASALPLRDIRYFGERLRTAQVMPASPSNETVAFGHAVTFKRSDGRVQTYRIVGEDEADPKSGSISFVSPIAILLLKRRIGDIAGGGSQEVEVISIERRASSRESE